MLPISSLDADVAQAQARMTLVAAEYMAAARVLAAAKLRQLEAKGLSDTVAARWRRAHLAGDWDGCQLALSEEGN